MEFRKIAYSLGWDHLKAFRGCMWTLRFLLEQIEFQRMELAVDGGSEEYESLHRYQSELGTNWATAEERFNPLLIELLSTTELGRLRAFLASAVLRKEPYDHEISDTSDVAEAKRHVRCADELVALHRIIERELRRAFVSPPESEKEVQDAFEILLIGKDIEYDRELPITSTLGGVRRPDFTISAIDAYIEFKLCGSSRAIERIKDEVSADIITHGKLGKRLFFVIFDRGYVRDPLQLESALQRSVHACPAREICVRIVKQ